MRRAFTLIELIAVIAILGLVVGATAWSMTERIRSSSRANVIGRIAFVDRMARLAAQRVGQSCELRFDLAEQRISRGVPGGRNSEAELHTLQLQRGARIERVVSADGGKDVSRDDRASVVTIPLSSAGRSVTYAVRIIFDRPGDGRDETDAAGLGREGGWMVFSGLTGQVTVVNDGRDIDNLFAPPATSRPDAR